MANLLDKASIVLTPTAYDNGKVLCAKPSEAPYGDFDFSRNSAATRVNAQGLVENVQILSSNLVQNGDFSEEGSEEVSNGSFSQEGVEEITNGDFSSDTNWVKASGTTISDGKLNITANSTNDRTFQNVGMVQGKIYKLVLNVSNYQSGSLFILFGGSNTPNIPNIISNGTYTFYQECIGTNGYFYFGGNLFNGSIDNVSVREVGQNWTLGTGWSIGEDKAVAVSGTSSKLTQSISGLSGKTCKVSFTLSDFGGSGSVRVDFGSVSSEPINTNGEHIVYGTYDNNAFELFKNGSFNGSITNISVKEVGQNWNFGTGWSIGNDVASYDDLTDNAILSQAMPMAASKKFQLSFTILNGSGARMQFTDNTGLALYNLYGEGNLSNGDYSFIFNTASSVSGFRLYGYTLSGGAFDITNISVIEITDDTNLPRISYENFSYQDALGSELVVNGDFATDSDWNKQSGWVITNGYAESTALGTRSIFQNTGAIVIGKTYQITYTILETNGGNFRFSFGGVSGINRNSIGTYTENIVATSTSGIVYLDALNVMIGKIDNVSVKEYLGQEVVPGSGCGSWLWEPQSTNLITQSELFSDASWDKVQTTIEAASITLPNGLTNGYKLFANTTGGTNHWIEKTPFPTATTGQDYTLSLFVKSAGSDFIQIAASTGFPVKYQNFNISTGTKASGNISDSSITDFGNGWYRISVTETTISASARYLIIPILSDGGRNPQFAGNADEDGVYIWGAQLEQQSYPTSYIPTSGSSVTRNQDVCNNGGSLASINSTEGTLYFEFKPNSTDISVVSINDGSTSNFIQIYIPQTASSLRYRANTSGVVQFNNQISTAIDLTLNHKYAIKWKLNDFSLWVDGIKINSQLIGSTPIGLNQINFYNVFGGGNKVNGKTKALAVWKEALSDQELADLTYPTPTDPTFALDFDTIATDFTFARGSEATYVDAQGLIQSTNEIGPELVTNGDFATDTDWVKQSSWSIANGSANCDGSGGYRSISQSALTNQVGKTYRISYEVSNYVSGEVRFILGGLNLGQIISANGVHTETIQAVNPSTNSYIYIETRGSGFTGSIDNVSVKEVITATNTPRLDYSTGAEAFLLEPQSTNLVTYSEDLSTYSTTNVTVSATTEKSPINSVAPFLITEIATTNQHFIGGNFISLSGNNTISCFVKNVSLGRYFKIWGFGLGSANEAVIFDTNTETIYEPPTSNVYVGGSAKLEDYGNGWFRCSITINTTTTNSLAIGLINTVTGFGNNTYLGDITKSVLITGIQLEQQSYATSYIPTSGTTVTRNQETCINATPEINSEEGVLYFEGSALVDATTQRWISLGSGGNANRVSILFNAPSRISCSVRASSAAVYDTNFNIGNQTNHTKAAIRYKNNDFAFFVNGVKVNSQLSGTLSFNSPLSELAFDSADGGSKFSGNTKDLQVYTKALSDAELIKLTT